MGNNRIGLKYILSSKQAPKRRAIVLHCEEPNFRPQEPVARTTASPTMRFRDFYLLYQRYKGCRQKESLWETKKNMIEKHLLPFFGDMRLCDIQAIDVIHWQDELMGKTDSDGKAFSQTFLRSIHSQLSAILNHASRFYHLPENPARQAGSIGAKEGEELQSLFALLPDELEEYQQVMLELRSGAHPPKERRSVLDFYRAASK